MEPESQQSELTDKRQRFVEEYPLDCNATQAAIRAGFSAPTARQMGSWLLTNVDIRAAVDERLRQKALAADEALKLTADVATSRLNDFMVVREVQGYEMSEQYVSVLLIHAKKKMELLQAAAKKLPKKSNPFDGPIADLYVEIVGYELDIERFGDDVTRLAPGRPVVYEQADLDLVALARAKEGGRIKSLKHTKEGVQVEMLDAQGALRDILKMHGKFVKKVEHSGEVGMVWQETRTYAPDNQAD